MMLPSIFGRSIFDDMMDDMIPNFKTCDVMRTDILEKDDNYEIMIDLPGFKKEDVKAKLENGYLTISATKSEEDKKFLRRESFYGNVSRMYYVGDNITKDDLTLKFENGVLLIDFPKDKPKEIEEAKYLEIK